MSEPTPDEVKASIVPKSDQLNADDLLTGPITVTITGVRRGDKEQPIIVDIEGHRPYKPCKTMRRILIAHFSDDASKWVDQRLTLYCDPEVTWAGIRVGGIRISHMSGLKQPATFIVTKTRGQRTEVMVEPLDDLSDEDARYVAEIAREIRAADTTETLKAIGFILKEKSQTIRDAVRPIYEQRKGELECEQ